MLMNNIKKEKNKMTIIYEGSDIYTLNIGSKTLELSLAEIEEIQRFGGDKSTLELDDYIEDLEMELEDVNSMLTKDREELEDKDEEISELQNKLYNLEQNLKNMDFSWSNLKEMESEVLDKDWK